MFKMDPKSRRQFIVGSGGTLLAIPFLPSLSKVFGQSEANNPTRKFISILTRNGYFGSHFYPRLGNSAFVNISPTVKSALLPNDISPVLGSYNDIKNDILLYRGVDYVSAVQSDHSNKHFLAAQQDVNTYPSIDYFIAKKVNQGIIPKQEILNASVHWYHSPASYSFVLGANNSIVNSPAYRNVDAIWSLFFGNLPSNVEDQARQRGQKIAVGDLVLKSYKSFLAHPGFSLEDKRALEQHIEELHSLQARVIASQAQVCTVPPKLTVEYSENAGQQVPYRDAVKVMTDLIVQAMKCDLTRVVNLDMSADVLYRGVPPYNSGHHDLSHNGDPDSIAKVNAILKEQFDQVAYLIRELKNAGLTKGLVGLVGNEIGNQNGSNDDGTPENPAMDGNHAGLDIMSLFFGDPEILNTGKLIVHHRASRSGRWRQSLGSAWNDVLCTTMQLCGVEKSAYEIPGNPGYGTYMSRSNFELVDSSIVSPPNERGNLVLGIKKI